MGEQIIEQIKNAGVVGAGGAGFPTNVKVNATATHVIVNGAECEPLLRVDQQLMAEMPDRLIKGIEAVMEATGASQGVIALKGKYEKAIEVLEEAVKDKPIKLFILGDFYPAGDEHVTVYEVTGKIIPEGGIPLKVGCVVSNVETLINVADALDGQPVIDTYLTVTGEVPQPITLKLPVGTSKAEALVLAGRSDLQGMVAIEGGPMMGKVIDDFSQPITKTTKGLILLPENHPLIQKRHMSMEYIVKHSKAGCIQCARCTDLCPRHMLGHRLSPHLIMRGLNYMQGKVEAMNMALACTECGACEFACNVMQLSPRRVNGIIKKELASQGIKLSPPTKPEIPVSTREYMKIPVKRLISNLGLAPYNVPAPLINTDYSPSRVYIPLHQHIGAPSVPVVEVNQWVERGSLIATTPDGALGANIHASISGIVKEISSSIVIQSDVDGGVE